MSVADRQRLTRRDRAACTMALACLRAATTPFDAFCEAMECGRLGGDDSVAYRVTDAANTCGVFGVRGPNARIALMLRAILRADAGDYGPSRYTPEALAYLGLTGEQMIAHEQFVGPKFTSCITPLWERAPATP